jgi:hypothetical protein
VGRFFEANADVQQLALDDIWFSADFSDAFSARRLVAFGAHAA